jgi:signal transduction histidine kinase
MIDRRSLAWRMGVRLGTALVAASALAIVGLYLHTRQIEAGSGGSSLVHAVIWEFFADLAWGIPLMIIAVIGVGAWTIRRELRQVREVSLRAAAITPESLEVRLSTSDLATEIRPLVEAFNKALDGLAAGFELQRRFTAAAAHEMRTPLAILRSETEALPVGAQRTRLLADLDRMARLTAQLLSLARLEAQPNRPNAAIDLTQTVREICLNVATIAAAGGKSIALLAPDERAMVVGDDEAVHAIARNLVENAIAHAPPGSEVVVEIAGAHCLIVSDRGVGVPEPMRRAIFERFWRGAWTRHAGSGLGLSIVAEAARRVGAEVSVGDGAQGGAQFIVLFRRPGAAPSELQLSTPASGGAAAPS